MITPEEWLPAAGMTLEPNALTVATSISEGNLAVIAGPGAGKTELLAQRADFLLRTGQCRYPRRILAISFKVDAARNLKTRVRRRCPAQLAARLDSYTFHAFAKRLIDTFRPVLTGVDALDSDYTVGRDRIVRRQIDFASMAPLATTILETSPVARAALRQTYGFVFLDEFQDCTSNQYNLIRAAFHGTDARLTAVGDAKQRIMRFAGALDEVFARFADDFEAREPRVLYLNYRSQPRLRRMQNAMVRVMEPSAAQDEQDLAGDGGTVEVLRFPNSASEAAALAERITGWIGTDGVPADEIALLVGKQVTLYTEALRAELRSRNVPFREENELQDLATEPVAEVILDFLDVVTGDREPDAYTRLTELATGFSVDEESERRHARLGKAIELARGHYRRTSPATPRELVAGLLELLGSDLLASLAPEYQQGSRLHEVIEEVLVRLEQLTEQSGDLRQALLEFRGTGTVKIMSIHKAKGLEFDVVVVLAVENEMFWGDPQDERSAYFVAVSRARRHLCLTVCEQRPRPSGAPYRWEIARTPHEEFLDYARSTQ